MIFYGLFIKHLWGVGFFLGGGIGHTYLTTVLVHPDIFDLLRGVVEHSDLKK